MGSLHPVEYPGRCNAVVILESACKLREPNPGGNPSSETLNDAKSTAKPAAEELALSSDGALTLFTSHLQQKLERQATLTPIHIMAFAWKAAGLSYAPLIIGGILN